MPEISDKPVKVIAKQRPHPALRRLARACIALARHHLRRKTEKKTVQLVAFEERDHD